jgi:hypothetical protein
MAKQNARESLRRTGRDFAYYPDEGRFNTVAIRSTKRPYEAPKQIQGSKAAGNRGLTGK